MSAADEVDWAARYSVGETPWDLGRPHPELARRLASGELASRPGARALVPGCGRGHDAGALAGAGFDTVGVDRVAALKGVVEERLGGRGRFLATDVLDWQPSGRFDLIFDHTFFCAIDPVDRPRWGEFVRRSLAPDGLLVALVFPIGRPVDDGGPPFGVDSDSILAALGVPCSVFEDVPVTASVGDRSWPERWLALRPDV